MSVQPHASHFSINVPPGGINRVPRRDGLSPGTASDKHPSPAIGFLIAAVFGAMIWAGLALLLLS